MMYPVFLVLGLMLSLGNCLPSYAQHRHDIEAMPQCEYCGMDRKHFTYSRMVIEQASGATVGVCSINCAAVNFIKDLSDPPRRVEVGDYKTRELIDAEKAFWVIGGTRPGVMSERAKWAFHREKDAQSFIKRYGGRIASFDEAMTASYEDIYEDMRRLKQMQMEHARSVSGEGDKESGAKSRM